VLLHAGLERRTVWRPIAGPLAGKGFRAIAVDQRGHGESDRAAEHRFPALSADVGRIVECLGPDRSVLVGASIGGLAALGAAARSQARVAGLVLVDVVAALDPAGTRTFLAPLLASVAPADRGMVGDIVDDTLRSVPALRASARRLRIPTLLVRGGASPCVGPREVAGFLRDVPHGLVRVVPRAGHLVAHERPAGLLRVLLWFLAQPAVSARLSGRAAAARPPRR
jgi:pimeloyl-ACP methyl ester carboxylesterase